MANKPADSLDGALEIRARLENSGLSLKTKSRMFAAFDRLCGGLIGVPAELLEGWRRAIQAKEEGREALIRAKNDAALRLFEGANKIEKEIIDNFLRNEGRKQDNCFAVASHAVEELLGAQRMNPEADSADQDVDDTCPSNVDQDWMNLFSDYAARASSDRLREQWGRILAGEIRKPNSFSFTTLRVIAEMDSDLARAFQDVYRLSVGGYGLRPPVFEGETLERFAHLEAAGLTQTDIALSMDLSARPDGLAYLIGDQFLLRITLMPNTEKISFPIYRITRVGKEIGSILPRDEREGLRQIGSSLTQAQRVETCFIQSRQGTSIRYQILDLLHEGVKP